MVNIYNQTPRRLPKWTEDTWSKYAPKDKLKTEKNKEGKEKSRSEKAREKKKEKASNEDMKVPYLVVPFKKDKDRHLARFPDIFRKLEITMPFGEAL